MNAPPSPSKSKLWFPLFRVEETKVHCFTEMGQLSAFLFLNSQLDDKTKNILDFWS